MRIPKFYHLFFPLLHYSNIPSLQDSGKRMKYSQAPAGGKAKAGPLHLDSILIWIFGMNIDRINNVGPIDIK